MRHERQLRNIMMFVTLLGMSTEFLLCSGAVGSDYTANEMSNAVNRRAVDLGRKMPTFAEYDDHGRPVPNATTPATVAFLSCDCQVIKLNGELRSGLGPHENVRILTEHEPGDLDKFVQEYHIVFPTYSIRPDEMYYNLRIHNLSTVVRISADGTIYAIRSAGYPSK